MVTESLKLFQLKSKKTLISLPKIHTPEEIIKLGRKIIGNDITIREQVIVFFLNNSNSILGYIPLSYGGITSCSFDIRLLFSYALYSLATGVIVVHNHPSENINESITESITESVTESVNENIQNKKYKIEILKDLKIDTIKNLCKENSIDLLKKSDRTSKMINKIKIDLINDLLMI